MSRIANPRQGMVLAGLIERHRWADGALVGAEDGTMLAYLLAQFPELALVVTAPWRGGELHARTLGAASQHPTNVLVLDAPQQKAPEVLPDGALDFAFLATNRDAEPSEQINRWLPKVGAWGWILGSDCNWSVTARSLDARLPGWQRFNAGVWGLPLDHIGR